MSLPQEIYELGKNIHKSQKFSENKICFNKIKDLNLLNPIFQTDIDENKINEMVSSYLKNPDYFYFKNKIVVAVINHYNDLYSLYLNENVRILYYSDNPIYEIINSDNKKIIKQKMRVLTNFRFSYYCVRFKKQFRDWLWVKIREPKIQEKYHPSYLIENLYEDTDLDTVLDNWVINSASV